MSRSSIATSILASMAYFSAEYARLAKQYQTETGINVLDQLDLTIEMPDGLMPPVAYPDPVWDENGVSQLYLVDTGLGDGELHQLVMLKGIEDFKERNPDLPPGIVKGIRRFYACAPGLAKLEPYSDAWHVVNTEMSYASFGRFGTNPGESLLVNRYERAEGNLPSQRLIQMYQDYVPDARSLPYEARTADACVKMILREVRDSILNSTAPSIKGVDFSPLPPQG